MKEKVEYSLLKRFALGKYSYKDYKRIASWFEDSSLQGELEETISQHWSDFSEENILPEKDLHAVYENLRNQIISEKSRNQQLPGKIFRLYSRIAAVIMIPLLIYTTYTLLRTQEPKVIGWAEIFAPPGTRTQFSLPDGSKGWLNSNTKLKYPLNFSQNRHISLTGEAFFEVAKNKALPFIVSTKNMDVKVVGTTFSVSALDEENTTEVILQEGTVVVDNPAIGLNSIMEPNQKLVLDNLKKSFRTTTLNAQQYNAWKDGLLIFRNEPLCDVFKRLSRWYNVKIIVTDENIKNYKYRATFQNEPIEEVIRLIALTLPIEYKIQKRTFNEQGIYAVREIEITKNKNRQ